MNVYALSLFLNTLRAARAPITGPGPTGTRPALATAWQLRAALGCRAPPTVPKTPPAPRRWCHLVRIRVGNGVRVRVTVRVRVRVRVRLRVRFRVRVRVRDNVC